LGREGGKRQKNGGQKDEEVNDERLLKSKAFAD
jgi:hypothetical protein